MHAPVLATIAAMNTTALRMKLDLYERLMRLDKPIGTLLLLWPTLWALWIAAAGQPTWALIVVFSLGTLLMRSAGCVMNDLADAGYDRHVERTRNRPLATGAVTRGEAFALAGFLVLWCCSSTVSRSSCRSWRCFLRRRTRSRSVSSRSRRPISASPSGSAFRWPPRRSSAS
jgi:4-hydroxybenzoate polyprenyltransferase